MSTDLIERREVDSIPSMTTARPSAAVWLDNRAAIVARMDHSGRISTCTIERGWLAEEPFLGTVVRAVGDRERVVILGPDTVRLELERAYVASYHRPDRLVDVELAGVVSEAELVERLRQLAS
jgi:hypothetical protein